MLKEYLNQNITRKTISSVNSYNEKTYTTTTTTIKGRFIYKREKLRTAENEEITTDAIIYTETAIVEGDVITHDSKDWVIRFVYPHVFLDGSTMGYKGVL